MYIKQIRYAPVVATALFCAMLLLAGFYDSRKVIIRESRQDTGSDAVFRNIALAYANISQSVTERLNLGRFFESENNTWQSLKQSLLVFGQTEAANVSLDVRPVAFAAVGNIFSQGEPVAVASARAIAETSTGQMPAATVAAPDKKTANYKILIIGDSFMAAGGGMGDPLEKTLLNFKNVAVARFGKVSSGLSRQDFFDWPAFAKKLIAQNNPNVAIMMFGSNDDKPIIDSNGHVIASWGSKSWDSQYSARIDQMLDIFKDQKAEVFVIGMPWMKNAKLSQNIKHFNSLYRAETAKYPNAHFISSWDLLSDKNGNYINYLTDKNGKQRLIRTADGVHLQYFAGYVVSDAIAADMEKYLSLQGK
jgi:hypothetical protein